MKPRMLVKMLLGALLFIFGMLLLVSKNYMFGPIPLLIGAVLIYNVFHRSRIAGIIFGHVVIIIGCYLVTWVIYLLPHTKPSIAHIFLGPLFWGLFSIFGGLCALFHSFCNCGQKSRYVTTIIPQRR